MTFIIVIGIFVIAFFIWDLYNKHIMDILSMITRVLKRDAGEVWIDGVEVKDWKMNDLARKVAFLRQANHMTRTGSDHSGRSILPIWCLVQRTFYLCLI